MANIRLQKILEKRVNEISQIISCPISIAFIRLALEEMFNMDEFEIDEAITDGGMDKGVDAIFEQENEDGENILYVVQAKYFEMNPDKTIDENSKNLIINAVENYILGDYPLNNLNRKLKEKVVNYRNRISNSEIDGINIVFIINGQRPGNNIISELDKFKENNPQIVYEIYTEEDLSSLFLPPSAKTVREIELKIVKDIGIGDRSFLNMPEIDIASGKVVRVDVYELAKVIEKNLNIFNANVRAYQSIRNKVNKQIAKTLEDDELIKQFIYLNNGITLLCDDFEVRWGNTIRIKKPSIINGCQTGNTILEVYRDGKIQPNYGFVLVRIIKSKDEDVKRAVILASNTQIAVRNRDLISEEKIQKELEKQFLTLGYYYDRKKGMHSDKPKKRVIDLEKAAQSYLALYLERPAEAKNKKSEIYKSYYDQIFNKDIIAEQLLIAFKLYNSINSRVRQLRKNAKPKRRSILGNSIMHLLPLYREWVLKLANKDLPIIEKDMNLAIFPEKDIDKIIRKMEKIVNNFSRKTDFNPQYFFKSANSLNKILSNKEAQIDYEIVLTKENKNRYRDLRYYKPEEFSINGAPFSKIKHWNDLFAKLMDKYAMKSIIAEGNLDFIDSGSRILLLKTPSREEKKMRKRIKNGLWLLTNFDSRKIGDFCFAIAEELDCNLSIKLRPTKFRVQRKYKKKRRKKNQ